MDQLQPWTQSRPGFAPSQGFRPSTRPQPPEPAQPVVSTLTREERLEAKRLSEEANFTYTGYQVVRREFISHRFDPAMTIRQNSITFNNFNGTYDLRTVQEKCLRDLHYEN